MTLLLIFFLLYLILPPGILFAIKMLKDTLKSYLFGRRRSNTSIRIQEKEGINRKLKKRIKFTMKDPRKKPIPFKFIFIGIYIIGGIVSAVAGFIGSFYLFLFSLFIAYFAMIFSAITANKLVSAREGVLNRMMELKASKMKLVNREKGSIPNPDLEFKVFEWDEDLITPTRMHIYLPTDFDLLQVDGFMESFNLIFGAAGKWIENDSDKEHVGFDFNAGVASIKVTPKLPKRADWHERYLNPEYIHWSFFPLALGSENGVPVYNEELDREERVLGFAVNSGQSKLSAKNGAVIGKEVTTSPQILIAGGTGGGKALQTKTPIKRVVD